MFGNLFAEAWDRGTAVSTGNNGFRTRSLYLLKNILFQGFEGPMKGVQYKAVPATRISETPESNSDLDQ